MSPARLTFQNWIVALGRDPSAPYGEESIFASAETVNDIDEELIEAVERALECLGEQERYLIIRFYYMGQGYAEMSRLSGRAKHRLAAMHGRALRKLRAGLAEFVRRRFGIKIQAERDCVICQSPDRREIEALIAGRDRGKPWRKVISALRERYAVNVKSPQALISHEKYHQNYLDSKGGKR